MAERAPSSLKMRHCKERDKEKGDVRMQVRRPKRRGRGERIYSGLEYQSVEAGSNRSSLKPSTRRDGKDCDVQEMATMSSRGRERSNEDRPHFCKEEEEEKRGERSLL